MNGYFRSRDGQVDGPYFEGQLISMHQAGQLVATDQLCMQDTEDWMPADMVMAGVLQTAAEVAAGPRVAAEKVAKRKRKPGNNPIAIALFVAGIGSFFFVHLAVGVILIIVALVLDCRQWICGECGNKVEKTAAVCPVCQVALTK